jgi:hypothetical protein
MLDGFWVMEGEERLVRGEDPKKGAKPNCADTQHRTQRQPKKSGQSAMAKLQSTFWIRGNGNGMKKWKATRRRGALRLLQMQRNATPSPAKPSPALPEAEGPAYGAAEQVDLILAI